MLYIHALPSYIKRCAGHENYECFVSLEGFAKNKERCDSCAYKHKLEWNRNYQRNRRINDPVWRESERNRHRTLYWTDDEHRQRMLKVEYDRWIEYKEAKEKITPHICKSCFRSLKGYYHGNRKFCDVCRLGNKLIKKLERMPRLTKKLNLVILVPLIPVIYCYSEKVYIDPFAKK